MDRRGALQYLPSRAFGAAGDKNIAIFPLEPWHVTLTTRLELGMSRLDPDYMCNVCVKIRVCSGYFGRCTFRNWFCYFAKARRAFSQSILVSTVCYFAKVFDFSQSILVSTVCLSACLSVCLSVTPPTGHSLAPIKIIFFIVDSAYPANVTFLL